MTTFLQSRQRLDGNERAVARRLANVDDGPSFAAAESDLSRLEKERRLLVLDSSLAFVDWKGGKETAKYADRAHRLKTQRASLGLGAETKIAPPVSARPENGHDSARVGPLVGSRSGRDFTGLQFRFAYHDLFSDDAGYRPDTHLEVLRTEVRGWWGDQKGQRDLRLHDLTFFEIISLAPSDEFVQPIGWRAKVGLMNLEDLPDSLTLAPSISGGIGAAVTPLPDPYERNLTLFAFAQGHADHSDELRNGYRAGLSWQAQALARFARGRARLNAGYEAKRYFLGDAAFVSSLWARAGVSITRNWEMRLSASDTAGVRETSAMLMAHFLM
jgi:hypothetical protein